MRTKVYNSKVNDQKEKNWKKDLRFITNINSTR